MLKGMHIAVLKGGPGREREVSLKSAEAVGGALRKLGARVTEVDVRDGEFDVPRSIDVAFNVIHGTFGEDGQVQRVLERRGIPYTGARVSSSERAFDKVISKRLFLNNDVPTPPHEVLALSRGRRPRMALPLVMKPAREGSSVGVHIIHDAAQLPAALDDLKQFGDEVIVEKFVIGRELTVGILGAEALPVIEICPREGFYSMNNKYPWMGGGGGTEYICPAEIGASPTQKTQAAAQRAHRALGVEVYSRVDVLLDEHENPTVLEVNTIPGMTESSLLPKAAAAAGIDFGDLCARIVRLSLELPP